MAGAFRKLLPSMHLIWCICFTPSKWPFCSRDHQKPPCFCLGMKVRRDQFSLILNAILLLQPVFKLSLKASAPFNWHTSKHNNVTAWKAGKQLLTVIHPCAIIFWHLTKAPNLSLLLVALANFVWSKISVATWRSCGTSGRRPRILGKAWQIAW